MVHPAGIEGKTTVSLIDVYQHTADLLFRNYNKDAAYRDPGDPKLCREVYWEEPVGFPPGAAMALEISEVNIEDAPQDAGADMEASGKLYVYGACKSTDARKKKQEAIRMLEAARHILIDNPTLPDADGTGLVFQIAYRSSKMRFEGFVKEDLTESRYVGILEFIVVYAELGY